MSAIPHEPSSDVQNKRRWSLQLLVPEMWASLAIVAMWLTVLFDAVFGPNIVNNTAGADFSSVPSAVVVAPFAFLGTWAVARHGFRQQRKD
jgi:hypothetical protein